MDTTRTVPRTMHTKLKVLIDMDDTIANYSEAFSEARRKVPGIQYPQSQIDFFRNLEPVQGAIRGVNAIEAAGHDVWFLTAPSVFNPLSYTEKRIWIETHFGIKSAHNLIIAYDKSMVEGDVLIDDGSCHGQPEFGGIWMRFGSSKYRNWDEVIRAVQTIAEEGVLRSSSHSVNIKDGSNVRFACCPLCGVKVQFWVAFPHRLCECCAERGGVRRSRHRSECSCSCGVPAYRSPETTSHPV